MDLQGWISVHRQIQNHWLWTDKPFSKGQAWIDMLMLANHVDNKILLGNELIEIKAGSFITSEVKLAERWGWSRHKVRDFLYLLQQDKMIVKKSDSKRTTIFLLNYGNFQVGGNDEEQVRDISRTGQGQLKDTNNNVNNDNTENNIINMGRKSKFSPPTVDQIKAYCLERNNHVNAERFFDYYSANGWVQGKGKPIKDWKACVRTWEHGNDLSAKVLKQNGESQEVPDFLKKWSV